MTLNVTSAKYSPQSGLCVGLDLAVPVASMVEWAKRVVDATAHVAQCYKINTAFYERHGRQGIDAMYVIREYLGDRYVIADAKRGDIGNTSAAYADALFGEFLADAITVAPYMGHDSVQPFIDAQRGFVYVLALTSNSGSSDFQRQLINGVPLYKLVMRTALSWPGAERLGFVIGATNAKELREIRSEFPRVPLLIPGVGAQGASWEETVEANQGGPAVINMSRAIFDALESKTLTGLLASTICAHSL
jgi:orotidine-5'-phosphate decarboxylase